MIGMDAGYEAANAVDDSVAEMWLRLKELDPDHSMLRFLTDVKKSTEVVPHVGGPDFTITFSEDPAVDAEYREEFAPTDETEFWLTTNRRINYFVALRGAIGEITDVDYSDESIQRV
tara:strand:+ start:2683 stop:3033 length:351 start_codon:yes stop_codon:yes gene_type:complete